MVSPRFKREEEAGPVSKLFALNCLASAFLFGLLFLFLVCVRTKMQSMQSVTLVVGTGLASVFSMLGYYYHLYKLPKSPWFFGWMLCVASGIVYSLAV